MPVSRGGLLGKAVMNADDSRVPLRETQCRSWNPTIDGQRRNDLSCRRDPLLGNVEVILNDLGVNEGRDQKEREEEDG